MRKACGITIIQFYLEIFVSDAFSEGNISDRGSINLAENETSDRGGAGSVSDTSPPDRPKPPLTLDILPPPPPNNNSSRRSDLV